ncbi:MAG: type III-B CRISPR module-associated protein Cmr3 [Thermoanaerobaculia bacterium]|nr:type III-B CRISPR module-associated protein Cmr3 [Thermoanaerobaculia bacterium]
MNTWILDAIDPLFFGDGRSVGTGEVNGRALPPPQVVAGLARTRQGLDSNGAWASDPERAKTIPVRGPFPALLNRDGSVEEWLFPRPADALLLVGGLRRLLPLDLATWGLRSNLPGAGLAPVGLAVADPSKPQPMRALWRWSELERWLSDPDAPGEIRGVAAPPIETRLHVAIDPATGRALDGALFSTAGRRMVTEEGAIGLGLQTSATIQAGVAPAGGERRLVHWRQASKSLPSAPETVLRSAEDGAVRILLATPAILQLGWCPKRLFDAPPGSVLIAASVGRAEVVSGWDLATNKGRPSRRCAPAGSVYFLRLGGDTTARRAWAEKAWLEPRADSDTDRLDGYGSVLLGAWDGKLTPPAPSTRSL